MHVEFVTSAIIILVVVIINLKYISQKNEIIEKLTSENKILSNRYFDLKNKFDELELVLEDKKCLYEGNKNNVVPGSMLISYALDDNEKKYPITDSRKIKER